MARSIRMFRALSLALMALSATSITVVAAVSGVLGPAGELIDVSGDIASAAALDVTRLALQVAILSVIGNIVLVGVVLRLATRWAQKPCVLERSDVVKALERLSLGNR